MVNTLRKTKHTLILNMQCYASVFPSVMR